MFGFSYQQPVLIARGFAAMHDNKFLLAAARSVGLALAENTHWPPVSASEPQQLADDMPLPVLALAST
jgi:hypothetical protein